jgi:diketogulonate reductase-like aldo/keto reductase
MQRRTLLKGLGAAGAGSLGLVPGPVLAQQPAVSRLPPLMRPIPSSGETLPAVGMGTWITFNVGNLPQLRAQRVEVLRAFFEGGGGLVDSSPMYGASEEVVGHCLARLGNTGRLFSATKVWTPTTARGREQMAESERLWGLPRLDLQQVHNLVNHAAHLETLFAARDEGRVRYVGVTTSHGMRHAELEDVMKRYPLDFVQLTYNAVDRSAENRLLPLAAERGMAVIANRPFRRGALPDRLANRPLPGWAAELDVTSWPEALLKFIVSHPAVTCAIPATTRVDHMQQNMRAGTGRLPDAALRRRIAADVGAA